MHQKGGGGATYRNGISPITRKSVAGNPRLMNWEVFGLQRELKKMSKDKNRELTVGKT